MHLLQSIYLKVVSGNFNTVIFFYGSVSVECFFFFFFLIFSLLVFSPSMFIVFLSHPGHSISFIDVKTIIQLAGCAKTTGRLMGQ